MNARNSIWETATPVVWMTGLSGAGKTTIANAMVAELRGASRNAIVLDGDTLREGLCSDLGFSDEDRIENVRRLAHVARLFQCEGYTVVVATISPLEQQRELARTIVGPAFLEVFIATPLATCQQRDPKGMYAKARNGQLPGFTGVSAEYQTPVEPDLTIDTSNRAVSDCVDILIEAALATRSQSAAA
ncbi:adenylyl-sulfate kinase [Paraburkholderia phosphatilytica]|uniref:adenylyl-sulfate kinase n=1 Tax=Paraburkholderia phosphatilytica TaxID=2282883 RepID=UPI000E522E27|nr:adenylyl-sulfate kinase [Paraburkholderia phosphatilytica]